MPRFYVQTATASDYVVAKDYMQAAKQVLPNVELEDLTPAEAEIKGYNMVVLGRRSQHYLRVVEKTPPVLKPVSYFEYVELFGRCNEFIIQGGVVYQYDVIEKKVWDSFSLDEFMSGKARVTVPDVEVRNHDNWLLTDELPAFNYDNDTIEALMRTYVSQWYEVLIRAYQIGKIKKIPTTVTVFLAGLLGKFEAPKAKDIKKKVVTQPTKTQELAIRKYGQS